MSDYKCIHQLGQYMTAFRCGDATLPIYVVEDRTGNILGYLEWYDDWNQFVFSADEHAVFSHTCLDALASGCRELTAKWGK